MFTLIIAAACLSAEPPTEAPASANMSIIQTAVGPERASRYQRFSDFYIKGVCGTRDLDRLGDFGVNTIRGYTLSADGSTTDLLDAAHERGLKVVLSEWMPHQGENKGNDGVTWSFDYDARGDRVVESFTRKLDAIGDHPAILMWGLGNEVPCDPAYLRVVNRMSEAIHDRFPDHLTSLTMINARPEAIANVKEHAPDLDVLGIQSYSPGAVRGAIRSTESHWGRPFYFSEFNARGPWNFQKTDWGTARDSLPPAKVDDVRQCYDAIHASDLCLGSTIFTWGYHDVNRPTYFSMLLAPDPAVGRRTAPENLLVTPQAEVMAQIFGANTPSQNQAPHLTGVELERSGVAVSTAPGEAVRVRLTGEDADGDLIRMRCWILNTATRRPKVTSGPHVADTDGWVEITAPTKPGHYLIMSQVEDDRGGASATTTPLRVE